MVNNVVYDYIIVVFIVITTKYYVLLHKKVNKTY